MTDLGQVDRVAVADLKQGALSDLGSFSGPAALAEMLKPEIDACLVRQLFHFATGSEPEGGDAHILHELTASFQDQGHRFDLLLLDFVSDPRFIYRVEEASP